MRSPIPVSTRTRPEPSLDQQAIEGLEQATLVVDLVLDQPAPQDPRHGPEQRPGVGSEGPGLDQPDADATTEFARPVHRIVHGHRLLPRDDRQRVGLRIGRQRQW